MAWSELAIPFNIPAWTTSHSNPALHAITTATKTPKDMGVYRVSTIYNNRYADAGNQGNKRY